MNEPIINLTHIKNVINDRFYPLLSNKDRYLILRGSRGSGKSVFIIQKLILRILKSYETGIKHRFLAIRKTQPDVRDSIFKNIKDIIYEWKLEHLCKVTSNPMVVTFTNGSEIILRGLDDPLKIKSMAGVTGAFLEEAIELDLEDFFSVDQILRGSFEDYFQIILSFNPTNKNSWIYEHFFKNIEQTYEVNNPITIEYPPNSETKATLHLSTYQDNRFLNSEYGAMLESYINISNFHYLVNCKGEWATLEGLVFDNWTMTNQTPSADFVYGCDFGYSNDPTAVTKVWKKDSDLYVQEKLYKTKLTNEDLIEWFLDYTEPYAIVYCDSAEPARIESMQRAGINAIPASKGKWSVKNGIMYIKEHRLHLLDGSTNLRKEVSGYIWKKRNNRTIDEPIEIDNHLIDSFRYAVFSHWFKIEVPLDIIFL